jgi:sulfhydrogenase subunit gamma (sulfur reductase)
MSNPYFPHPAVLEDIVEEGPGLKTFLARFQEDAVAEAFRPMPGQFLECTVYGVGEAPFGVACYNPNGGPIRFSVQKMGKVTSALHGLSPGDTIGLRGPYGRGFPVQQDEGKNLFIIGGGIGLPPLRSVVEYVLANRGKYGKVLLVYGARSPELLCYKDALREWEASPDIEVALTVDKGDETWSGHEGFVPQYCTELGLSPANAVAYTVGPPIMIKFVIAELTGLGFTPEQIIVSLEARMKCGIGKCGRCNVGPKFVCLDGPVFSYAELLVLGQA